MENRLPNYKKSLKNCYAMYVALPCIAQEYSNAILEPEPLSLAYLLRQCFPIYLSSSMSLSWWCHVWSALLHFKKLFRETVFSLPTLARHTAANVLKDLHSLRLRQWLGNWFEAFLWHTILLSKESEQSDWTGPRALATSVLWFIPALRPRRQRG